MHSGADLVQKSRKFCASTPGRLLQLIGIT
jgi:hypothetical protein